MKRIYRFAALFASLFLALSVNVFAYDPVNSGVSYTQTTDSMIYTNTSNIDMGAISNGFNTIPAPLRELFRQKGIKLYYTEGAGNGGYAGYTLDAVVTYDTSSKRVISVNQKPNVYLYTTAYSTTVIPHEYGHVLDGLSSYINGKYTPCISDTQEWQGILANGKSGLKSIDSHANQSVDEGANEAFAEAFRLYCTNPNGLKSACPDVYNFIAAQVAKYSPTPKALTKKNFDYKAYADTYPDLKAAFGYDKDKLWDHYNNFGKAEGRTAKAVQ
jgi:hypothetical protein